MQTLLPSQGNHRLNAKTAQQRGVDVCKAQIGQGVKSPKIQSTHRSPREKEQADENMGGTWTQRFLPRRSKQGQQVHENLFTLIKSEAKANPNRNDIAAHCGQNGYKEADRKQQLSERRWSEGKPPALLVAVETGAATRPSGVEQPPKRSEERRVGKECRSRWS